MNSGCFAIGDIVSRTGTDEQEVLAIGDLILVRCIKAPHNNFCAVGDEEWNIPQRYNLVRKRAMNTWENIKTEIVAMADRVETLGKIAGIQECVDDLHEFLVLAGSRLELKTVDQKYFMGSLESPVKRLELRVKIMREAVK